MRVRFSREAQVDMLEAWNYLFEQSPEAADAFSQSISDHVNLLRQHPLIGPERSDVGRGIRGLVTGKYIIF